VTAHIHRCSAHSCPSQPLTTLRAGGGGIISCLTDPELPRTARLASLGLLPGVEVRVVQTYPAWVVRLGFTDIALDDQMASLVRVLRTA